MRTIKLSIRAVGVSEAPTVVDLLEQVRDFFEILNGVEEAVAEDGSIALEWRIVGATTNSPITMEAQAFARHYGTNVDRRADVVVRSTAIGLNQLREKKERPAYFTDAVLRRAERLFERVTNGLSETAADYGTDLPTLSVTPVIARAAAANTKGILAPPERPYKEIGSIEGTARAIERDGFGRVILRIRERLTGEDLKCIVRGEAEEILGRHQIRDIWRNRRVRVHGTMHYRGLGRLNQVEAGTLTFLRDRSDLPDIDDITDVDFTGGMRSEDYLERLRDG